ncbi:hypothetical protein BDV33DRAFT_177308 [Aspergillus novoparasiticus]|uniref:Uncharacterized protein n=1 Tax=Aspergillus novoparasiticus TaxID=986946 RepID=A0A5N6EKK3_9EURO|nr:hypothetical protein BDV33DRAFT_177308 [Aspergillus novoparasiticus]
MRGISGSLPPSIRFQNNFLNSPRLILLFILLDMLLPTFLVASQDRSWHVMQHMVSNGNV